MSARRLEGKIALITAAAREAQDRGIVATETDVRDFAAINAAVSAGVAQLGGLQVVVANAVTGVQLPVDLGTLAR
jgi:NAD(P)-dependent dehydrogenase (short-subunit alcohol dehydrogenase family)